MADDPIDVIAREVIAQCAEVRFHDHQEFFGADLDEGTWTEIEARILVLLDGLRPKERRFDRAYEKLMTR